MKHVLLAGVTGYLGGYIASELRERDLFVRAITRSTAALGDKKALLDEIVEAQLTKPAAIKGCCDHIDVVISTVGITRQKDALTYMDVDYQANMNLLHEAIRSGVKKFIYVSVLNGEKLGHLKICAAKELFVEQLKKSGLDYCIIRPNGFFSDMTDFYRMGKKGRVYLFGNGELKMNPIHGKDLAAVCVDAIGHTDRDVIVGGPETFTHNEIARLVFDVLDIQPKITYIPHWLRTAFVSVLRTVTGSKTYGPIEFFMTVMGRDMIAPEYGNQTLRQFFVNCGQGACDDRISPASPEKEGQGR